MFQRPRMRGRIWCSVFFKTIFLRGLDEVLAVAERGGLPRPKDLRKANQPGVVVEFFPFILDIRGAELEAHRSRIRGGKDFLKKMFQLDTN